MTEHEKEFVDKLLDAGLARYSAVEPPPGFEQRLLAALKLAARSEESVDELVDAGLARYSAEPRSGLEQRILAGLRAQPQPSPWLNWRWIGSVATAAAALAIVIFFFVRQPQSPPLPAPPAPAQSGHPNAQAPSTVVERPSQGRLGAGPPAVARATVRRTPRRVEQARVESPRLETFPAPAPLSEQERLLLLFMHHASKEQLLARQLGAGPVERLDIQRLSVAPLEFRETTTEN